MSPRYRMALALALGALALLILVRARAALTPFLLATGIAYLLNPLVSVLTRHRVRRDIAVGLLVAVFFLGAILLVLVVTPLVRDEIGTFINKLPAYFTAVREKLDPWLTKLHRDYPLQFEEVRDRLTVLAREQGPLLLKPLSEGLLHVFTTAVGILFGIFGLVIVPVIVIYELLEFAELRTRVLALVPPRWHPQVIARARQCDTIIGEWLRGQLSLSLVVGALEAVGLMLLGVPLAIVVGIGSGLLNAIPYVGFAIGIVVATFLGWLEHRDLAHPIGVVVLYLVVQIAETGFIGPRIVGHRIGLHPLAVIFALLAGGELLGFVGVLLAVPVAAVLQVFLLEAFGSYRESGFYGGGPPDELSSSGRG